jgi:hypothetical protein
VCSSDLKKSGVKMFIMAVRYMEQIWLIIRKNCDSVVIQTFTGDGRIRLVG